ncbi:MAG: pyruvate ferredoxin oxidoreductase [Limnochordia bacterium]|jgi:pyruvate ferredoxin oxidoreductase alpha subunit
MANALVQDVALTGNEAVAQAMRQVHPDVVAAYPITPQTEIVQIFSTFVADGLVETEYVPVESEHSAMSATVGAAAAGARAMTATSANGLALMWEVVNIAAGLRLPIVMPVVNRAISAPINIHCDHSDSMGVRDAGWIQLFSENAQEAYDNLIQAVKIAEDPACQLPVMVTMDGFIISHGMENVSLLSDREVEDFVGQRQPQYTLLDADNPTTVGALDLQDFYFEHRRQLAEAVFNADAIVAKVGAEFGQRFGRSYEFIETYQMDDAQLAIVVLGSTAGTTKHVVGQLRESGIKAGLVKIRMYRPFPVQALREALAGVEAVAVLDRSDGLAAMGGPVFNDVRASLYSASQRPLLVNYIYGLGGRDINLDQIHWVYRELGRIREAGSVEREVNYLGVRE